MPALLNNRVVSIVRCGAFRHDSQYDEPNLRFGSAPGKSSDDRAHFFGNQLNPVAATCHELRSLYESPTLLLYRAARPGGAAGPGAGVEPCLATKPCVCRPVEDEVPAIWAR